MKRYVNESQEVIEKKVQLGHATRVVVIKAFTVWTMGFLQVVTVRSAGRR